MQSAATHSAKLAEDMDDIKQQLKDLTDFHTLITPVVAESKSAYDNDNCESEQSNG